MSLYKGHNRIAGDGIDGFSPTVSLTKADNVATISVTDIEGTKSININDNGDILQTQIGSLEALETTDKTSIVNAINEVKASAGGSSDTILGYSIIESTPNHNDVIRFDRRLSENGAWVLSNEPLDASAIELSYTSDSTEKYGKQTISANTLNGNLKAQRYKSVKVTASIGTKYSSSSDWITREGESIADIDELGQVAISFSKTDLSLYIGTIEIDTEGNISINVTYSKSWRGLKVTIEGVW